MWINCYIQQQRYHRITTKWHLQYCNLALSPIYREHKTSAQKEIFSTLGYWQLMQAHYWTNVAKTLAGGCTQFLVKTLAVLATCRKIILPYCSQTWPNASLNGLVIRDHKMCKMCLPTRVPKCTGNRYYIVKKLPQIYKHKLFFCSQNCESLLVKLGNPDGATDYCTFA